MNAQRVEGPAFARLLRSHGFRATAGRIALLGALRKARTPISAERIAEAAQGDLDPANAYRALEAFTKAGIVRRVDVGHRHMHYELIPLVPHHHHFVCEDCGARAAHA